MRLIREGRCTPPNVLRPFRTVSRRGYASLDNVKRSPIAEQFGELRQRVPRETYGNLLAATSLTWRASTGHFPAYRFHVGEFLNDEWLALVDWHKPFHRDHMVHQTMTYYVARSILDQTSSLLTFRGRSLREGVHILYGRQRRDNVLPVLRCHREQFPHAWP